MSLTVGSRPGPQPMSWVTWVCNVLSKIVGSRRVSVTARSMPGFARPLSQLSGMVYNVRAVAGPSRAAADRRQPPPGVRPLSVTVRSMPNFARPSSTCGPSLIPPGPSTSFKPFTKVFRPLPGRRCRRRLPPGLRPLSGICPTLPDPPGVASTA
jgi:hypothetical protein